LRPLGCPATDRLPAAAASSFPFESGIPLAGASANVISELNIPGVSKTPPDGWGLPAITYTGLIARFFFARQRPLQTAAVNRDIELFLNGLDTGDCRQAGLCSSQGHHIVDDFGGQLVPFFGPAVLGKQATQAGLLESGSSALKICPQALQRSRSISNTVASRGACPTNLTSVAGSFRQYTFPLRHSGQSSPEWSVACVLVTLVAPLNALAL
jgi:hypothetical protein